MWNQFNKQGGSQFFVIFFFLSFFLSFFPCSYSENHMFSRTGQSCACAYAHMHTDPCANTGTYAEDVEEVVRYVLWQLCRKSLWVWPQKKSKNRMKPSSICDSTRSVQICLPFSCEKTLQPSTHTRTLFPSITLFHWIFILILFYCNLCLNQGTCGKKCRISVNSLGGRWAYHMAQIQGEQEI